MTDENFVERVRKAADLAGGQLELSKKTGISARTINSYALGESDPSRSRIAAIAKAANVSAGWLVTGEGPMLLPDSTMEKGEISPRLTIQVMPDPQPCFVDASGQVRIPQWIDPDPAMFDYVPMAEAQLSGGGGCFVISEDVEGYYAFRKSWLKRVATSVRNLVLMRVNGDSMVPNVCENDTVMIDTGRRDVKEGTIYALRVDSTTIVKRLSLRIGGKVLIVSDNFSDNRPELAAYEASMQDLHVIGQVIFVCRTLVPE